MRKIFYFLALAGSVFAAADPLPEATALYNRTEFKKSLAVLSSVSSPSAPEYCLMGRNHMMLGDFKRATDSIQKAVDLEPNNSEYYLWLGRAWGRRAETATVFSAPLSASKARQAFERSLELNPKNLETINDLFDYYLEAPGFLGGGVDKARALAERIREVSPAVYYYAEARIADKCNEYNAAEQHFRRAIQLAPRQVGRLIDLARYLAKHGRVRESDAVFAQAQEIAPDSPEVLFWRAKTYVQEKQNLDKAQELLKRYLQSNLTADDPPREEAEKLLKKTAGG